MTGATRPAVGAIDGLDDETGEETRELIDDLANERFDADVGEA